MPLLDKTQVFKRTDLVTLARFLHSDEGREMIAYLRRGFVRSPENNEASLIRNAVGFDAWHRCIDLLEDLGELPSKPINPEPADRELER